MFVSARLHDGELSLRGDTRNRSAPTAWWHDRQCLTLAALACLTFAALAGVMSPVTLFVPMLFAALGNGLTIPNATAGAISVNASMVGTAAGLAGFLQMGIGAGSAQLVGILQDAAPFAVFWVMAAAAVLAALTHRLALRARAT
jgi:MFS transporter, DHA1 family, multidrug resistance protein